MKKIILLILPIALIVAASCSKGDDNPTNNEDTTPIEVDTPYTKTIVFKASDELEVTADIYHVNNDYPVMVMCHQAGWSRGEYKETAPLFNELGYNCIAIDQRSGSAINGVENETAKGYSPQGLPQDYVEAEKDIIAAVEYAANLWGKNVILIGSSYSSGLVLKVAKENDKVDMVLSFSPNEYYGQLIDLGATITGLNKPTFITSRKDEAIPAKALFDVITATNKVQFVPSGTGYHGSRALWPSNTGNEEYWTAVKDFLGK